MNDKLIKLIDKKISELQRFNEITNNMLYEDIDGVEQIMEEREKIVATVEGISVEIKQYINDQSIEQQKKLHALFTFEDISDLNDDLLKLQDKLLEQKILRDTIREQDSNVIKRFRLMQDELLSEMGTPSKAKKVADYFSQSTININKGSHFNASN